MRGERGEITGDENGGMERVQRSNASVGSIDVAGDLDSTSVRVGELGESVCEKTKREAGQRMLMFERDSVALKSTHE